MANFCNVCGSPVSGPFCGKCGADTRRLADPAPSVAAPNVPPAKGSPLIKILVAVFALIFVFAAVAVGGVWYAAHRVSQKVHEMADLVDAKPTVDNTNSSNSSGINGDLCRFLSTQEVGRAIGIEIVRAESSGDGCSYLAKGDEADMTSRHMTAIMKSRGADTKQQQMIQTITGGFFKSVQSENKEPSHDKDGNVPVFTFEIQNQSADVQMQLNKKVLGSLGPGGKNIPDIGDEAFDTADSLMMVRKGDKLIRIMYTTCPCAAEAIKPLARKLAAAL